MSRRRIKFDTFRSIGKVTAEIVADLRFRRQVERLYRLGPRVVGEVFAHLGAKHGIQTSIEQTIECFAELEPKALEATGGDHLPPVPLHIIRRAP